MWVHACSGTSTRLNSAPPAELAFLPMAYSDSKLRTSVHAYWNQHTPNYSWIKQLCMRVIVWHCLALRNLFFTRLSCPSGTFAASATRSSSWFTVRSSRIWSTKLQLLPQQNSECQRANHITNGSKITLYLWSAVQSSNSNQVWVLLFSFMV